MDADVYATVAAGLLPDEEVDLLVGGVDAHVALQSEVLVASNS